MKITLHAINRAKKRLNRVFKLNRKPEEGWEENNL